MCETGALITFVALHTAIAYSYRIASVNPIKNGAVK